MVAPHRPQNMATLAAVTHHATSHYSPTETNLDLPEVTTATRDAAPSTHKNPESGIYYCEGIVDEQPVKAIEDSDTLARLPGGGNQLLIIDEQVKNQWNRRSRSTVQNH